MVEDVLKVAHVCPGCKREPGKCAHEWSADGIKECFKNMLRRSDAIAIRKQKKPRPNSKKKRRLRWLEEQKLLAEKKDVRETFAGGDTDEPICGARGPVGETCVLAKGHEGQHIGRQG